LRCSAPSQGSSAGWRWITKVRFESRFLLLAVPPVAILIILNLAGLSLTDSIHVVIWLEALSLSFWAGLAAYRAGLRERSLAMAVLAGLVVSGIVPGLLVILEPGKPVRDGAAAATAQLG
jgi:sulfite exporter TauE/SafE